MSDIFSIEAEQALLGGIIIDGSFFDRITDVVESDDFFNGAHKAIFKSMSLLCKKQEIIDVITIANELENNDLLEKIGGLNYLAALGDGVAGAVNARRYAEIVLEKSAHRKIQALSLKINHNNGSGSAIEILKEIQLETEKLSQKINSLKDNFVHIKPILYENIDQLQRLFERDSTAEISIAGLSTGIECLDNAISGLMPGKLIFVAGRPGMGKSSLAMNFVEHIGIYEKKTVAVFSLEMPAQELTMRMIGSVGKINSDKLRNGNIADRDWECISVAIGKLSESQIFFDSSHELSFDYLSSKVKKLKNKNGLDLIVIDYLQLMKLTNDNGFSNKASELGVLTSALKRLSLELNIPIVVLSQLNRKCEERPNKRPMLSDLRDSGSLEQDADIVLFIYRDEKYNPDTDQKGTAEIIIAKQRGGRTGTVRVAFEGEYTKFSQLENGQNNFQSS